MPKKRYFVLVSHCLLNPSTRVHILDRRFNVARIIIDYFLSKNISIIQLPCPEFTAMGYMRNPQGRQQYDNVFFKKHCKNELSNYVDMACELRNNNNTPLCYIGIQGSPTCSVNWRKHKTNKYKTESMIEDEKSTDYSSVYGVMTLVLDEMLKENNINIPYFEAPVKESVDSELTKKILNDLDDLLHIPDYCRYSINISKLGKCNEKEE